MNKEEMIKKIMQHNKAQNTSIEVLLCKALWHKGVRFRKNVKDVLGKPDICIKKYRLAIFCDGDFWHGNKYKDIMADNRFIRNKKFWNEKIKRNRERDLEITISLRDQGWTVLRFWESEMRQDIDGCVNEILKYIKK